MKRCPACHSCVPAAMSTFKLIEFLDAESLLVCQQVAPDLVLERPKAWTPPDVRLKYIEPLPEIDIIMKQKPRGSQALMVKH